MARDYICLYHSYLDAIQALGDAERGRLLTAMLEYSITGDAGHLSGNERFIWPLVKAQIDRDCAKYEERCAQNAENGRKRVKRTQAKASEWKRLLETASESSQDKGEGKGKDKGKGEGKDEGEGARATARPASHGLAVAYYLDKLNPTASPSALAQLEQYAARLTDEVVICAVDEALDNGANRWSYVRAVLQAWQAAGVRDLESLNRYRAARAGQKGAGNHADSDRNPAQQGRERRHLPGETVLV